MKVGFNNKRILITVCLMALAPMAIAAGADSDVSKLGVPTLDRVKAEETTFLNTNTQTYSLTEITDDVTAPDGAVTVKLGDKEYYYTPSDNKEVLQLLSATGSTALVETTSDKALYSTPDGKYYTYDSDKLKDSAYTLTKVTPADASNLDDNVIVKYEIKEVTKYYDPQTGNEVAEADKQEGVNYREVVTKETVPHYYEVNLAKTEYGSGAEKIYFNWEKDADGNYTLKEGASATGDNSITYSYDPANSLTRKSNPSGDIIGNFIKQNIVGTYNPYGGAIYNSGSRTIGDITGDFIGNYAIYTGTSSYSYAYGGAIYNEKGTIGDITGDFIGNYVQSSGDSAYGGAIYNYVFSSSQAIIGNITGDFIGNYASGSSDTYGGAIYNRGTIGDITGDFIGNFTSGSSGALGGAIYNYATSQATIGNITGDFIGNYASTDSYSAYGGAIYNSGSNAKIGNITGDFIGNYVSSASSSAYGGAIYNKSGTIGDITGDFIGNYASGSSYAYGGAIYNSKTIGNITGDFIGNSNLSSSSDSYGGVINNSGTIISITASFVANFSSADSRACSGGIYNSNGTIGEVTGDFIGNYAYGSYYAFGGAIYNYDGEIGEVTGDFIGNYAQATSGVALGGAIDNSIFSSSKTATIGLTNNNFLNNYAISESSNAKGGAIFTNYDLTLNADNGTSLISGNYTESSGVRDNNAIYVANYANSSGTIERNTTLTLNTVNNGKIQIDDKISGGSIYIYYQSSHKFWETSDHAYNLALTGDGTGTISLYDDVTNAKVTANNVTVDFANGVTNEYDFVSLTDNGGTKYNIDVDLTTGNADKITTQNASSGTILLNIINVIGSTTQDEVTFQILDTQSDSLKLALGDNIHTVQGIDDIITDTVLNTDIFATYEGIRLSTTNTTDDSITIQKSGVFDTLQLINQKESQGERNFNFVTADNYMVTKDLGETSEGTLNINGLGVTTPSTINAQEHTLFVLQNATTLNIKDVIIENSKDFAINAENANAVVNLTNTSIKNTQGTGVISNVDLNVTADGAKSEFSGNTVAFDIKGADKTLTLNAINEGEITLSDEVKGASGFIVKLTGDDKSKININNNINNANFDLENINLYLSKEDLLNNSLSLTLNSGSINLQNDAIGVMHLPTLNLNGTTNLALDVDLLNETMDRVTADNYTINPDAILNVKNLNLLSTTEKETVSILFADAPLAGYVQYNGESPLSYKGTNTAYSPIYKYDVSYGINQDDGLGYFTFNRAGGGSSNPSDAFSPPVLAEPVAAQSGGKAVVNETLRFAFQHADNFSILPSAVRMSAINQNKYAIVETDEAPKYQEMQAPYRAGFWVKPFTTFESMDLKNGPDVDAVTYGTLIGFDTQFRELGRGWHGVTSGYVGYNGSSLSYNGVDTYMNGGLAGVTETLYKGNFFTALTVTAGASAGTTSSSFGSEDFAMLLAGIGSKTGYNFEFKEGKYIIQPSMFINYSFINTFDYTNAAGVRIDSDPVHSLQLNPTIRFIANLPNKWQPYASVGMVWNVLNSSKVTANDVALPRMSVKPYVEYGVGVQRTWADKFTAFFQAMIRNGGRTGVALTGGFRWSIGSEPKYNNVKKPIHIVKIKDSKTKSQYKRNIEEIQVKSITLPDEEKANSLTKKFSWAIGK